MSPLTWFAFVAVFAIAASIVLWRNRRGIAVPNAPAFPAPTRGERGPRVPSAPGETLRALEYSSVVVPAAAAVSATPAPGDADFPRTRIRDRYIGARFPGAATGISDLADVESVIKMARLFHDDGQRSRAREFLDIAIESHPALEPLWLARLELAFLQRAGQDFHRCARGFRATHPASDAWPEVRELGRALGLADTLFQDLGVRGVPAGEDAPWPQLPNWLRGSWDFTPEILRAELRRALRAGGTGHLAAQLAKRDAA